MEKIQEKIQEYISNYSVRELQRELSIGASVVYSILKHQQGRKYFPHILEKFYDFFKLEKDNFFYDNVKTYNGKQDPLGNLLYKRRKKLGYSLYFVAKQIKGSERHLRRLESGDVNYNIGSYYLQELLKLYKFSKFEQNQILAYSISLSNILMISGKEKDVL